MWIFTCEYQRCCSIRGAGVSEVLEYPRCWSIRGAIVSEVQVYPRCCSIPGIEFPGIPGTNLLQNYKFVQVCWHGASDGIVCWYNFLCLENCVTKKWVIYWLLIIREHYALILLFVFDLCVCRKNSPFSLAYDKHYLAVTSMLSKNQMWSQRKQDFRTWLPLKIILFPLRFSIGKYWNSFR